MNLIELLSKNEKLKFWNRCRIHRKEPEFVRHVLEAYNNPDYLHLYSHGKEYKGEIVYLIEEMGQGMGFFAELGVVLIKLYFADERGLTPYVQWGNNYLYYEPEGVNGEKNAFLYYFKQVSHVSGIEKAIHLVKSDIRHYEQVKSLFNAVSYDVSEEYVDAMSRMLRKYISYNEDTEEYLMKSRKELIGNYKTIGVHFRGTDFRKQYNNHPVAIEIEQLLDQVNKIFKQGNYERIFLATDENAAVNRFKETYGDKLRIYEDTFRDDGGNDSIAFSHSTRKNHKYLLGLEVLRDEYTLTYCEGLVCGYSNVTFMARIMRKAWVGKKYQDYILIDNGIYHNKNYFKDSIH